MRPPSLLRALCGALVLSGLAVTACGREARSTTPIRYVGSGTIGATVLTQLGAEFVRAGGAPLRTGAFDGSSAGLREVQAGGADLAGLSRGLVSAEKAAGTYYVIFAYDALTVLVHADNPVRSLTREQVKALFSGRVRNWRELGGADLPIDVASVALDQGSGTVDFFREVALEGVAFGRVRTFEQPGAVLDWVRTHPGAVSFGSLSVRSPGLRFLEVDGVPPDAVSVRSADYPLTRPMVLATRDIPDGAVREFLEYVMSPEGQAVVSRVFVSVRDPGPAASDAEPGRAASSGQPSPPESGG